MWQIPLTNQSDLPCPGRRFIAQQRQERAELRPVRGGGSRRCKGIQQREVPVGCGEMRQRTARRRGTDTWQQLQHPETGDGVSWVFGPTEYAQHVLDMGRFKELQATVFDKRDAAAREFDLKLIAVVARAKQHRLSFQVNSCLAVLQDTLDHVLDLRGLIGRRDQLWPLARWLV